MTSKPTILALGFVLAAAGSAAVYAIPDDSAALIAAQAVVGGVSVVGCGAARLGPAWRVRSKAAVFANGTLWRAQRAGNWTGTWTPAPAVEAGAAG